MGWVLLTHPDTGGNHLVPAGATVPFVARGWVQRDMPEGLDADDPYAPAGLDEALAEEARLEAKRASARKTTKPAASATDKKE